MIRLLARLAVVARNSNLAALGVIRVRAVRVVDAAADAETVLGGLDLLHVESTDVVSREDAERLRRYTIVSLPAGVELTALVTGVQAAEVRGVDAPGDLADGAAGGTGVRLVLRIGEEVGGELALVREVVAGFGSAVGLGTGALSDADISVRIARCDEAHILEGVDLDDIVAAVLELVDIGDSCGSADEEGDDGEGAHDDEVVR